jgi:hypothetical protein
VVVGLLSDQTASVAFADDAGMTRSVLGISADGSANIVFADRGGSTRAGLGGDAGGRSTFTLADRPNDTAQAPASSVTEGPGAPTDSSEPAKARTVPKRKR